MFIFFKYQIILLSSREQAEESLVDVRESTLRAVIVDQWILSDLDPAKINKKWNFQFQFTEYSKLLE